MVQVARFRVGQNLHQSRTTRPDAEDLAAEWVRAVEGWYGEVAQFPATEAAVTNYRFRPATGHYSQLVWAATTRLGCGLAQYREGRFVVLQKVPSEGLQSRRRPLLGPSPG